MLSIGFIAVDFLYEHYLLENVIMNIGGSIREPLTIYASKSTSLIFVIIDFSLTLHHYENSHYQSDFEIVKFFNIMSESVLSKFRV